MSDGRTRCALRLRFILDTPIPLSLGYRLLVTGPRFHHRDTEDTEVGSYLCGLCGLAVSNPVSLLLSKNSLITISTQSSRSWVFSSGVRPSSLSAGSSCPITDEVKSSNKCLILLFSILLRCATARQVLRELCALGRRSYFQKLSYLG